MSTQPTGQHTTEVPTAQDGTRLTSPRAIACIDCHAPKFSSCKRVKPGRKVQIEYLKSEHVARRDEFQRLLAAAQSTVASTENGTPS